MSDSIADAGRRADEIIGLAKIEAARIRRQAADILEAAKRDREDAARLNAMARAGMDDLRRRSAAGDR